MSKRTIAAAIGAALLGGVAFSTQSSAATFTVFGPKDYSRSAGKPTTASSSFSVLNPGTFYVVHVYNGGKNGQFPDRASSSVIGLNGVEVVGPSDFNQQVWHIERPVGLLGNNELTVEIRSKPGSGMTIEILGIDNDPPTIVAVVSPPPNAAGWNNSSVTVSFECADAASGVAFCSPPVAITSEGASQLVTGTAIDRVGYSATVSVAVNLDKTAPTIAAQLSEPPNAAGWNATEVTVSFDCGDALSGVQSCPAPISVGEGAGQVISGTAVDRAGNTAGASVTVNVDTTPPVIEARVDPPPNGAGWNRTPVTVSFECVDATSGVASCPGPVSIDSEGADQVVEGAATDLAGHTSSTSVTVNLDKTPPDLTITEDAGEPALEVLYVRSFELAWNDGGSGARQDGSFYRPVPPPDYEIIGYYGQGNYGAPDGVVAVVKELIPGALAQPVRYDAIWTDSGSGADRDGAFWRPVPPSGYTCLGVVVTGYPRGGGYAPPSTDAVRCVRSDLAAPGKTWLPIWNDESSGAGSDLGTWVAAPANEHGVHLGLMAARGYGENAGYAPPASGLWVLDRTKVRGAAFPMNGRALEVLHIDEFELAWNDSGSGADRDGSFYRPLAPPGFSVIGYYGQGGYGPPNGVVAVVKELTPGALAAPMGYQAVWTDSGSGSDRDGAFWRPIPPDGYVCLGLVVTGYTFGTGYAQPSLDAIRCVRRELTAPAGSDRSIWDDRGSGADSDVAVWHLVPNSVGGVYLGTFTASGSSYDTAPSQPFYVLQEAVVTADLWVMEPAGSYSGVASDALSGLDTVSCNGTFTPVSGSAFRCDVALSGHTPVTIIATDVAGNEAVFAQTATSAADALEVSYATDFEWVWDDSGSGASYDGAFYRPVVTSDGFSPLGHYGQSNYGEPVGVLLVARERTSGALAAPVGYELIWTDAGSGATNDGAFWWPLPPPGYRCLGVVATGYPQGGGYAMPSLDEVRCVREELVAPGYVAGRVWIDERSKAHRDFGSWQIAPRTGNGLHTGMFTGQSYPSDQGYAKPTLPVFVLDARAVAGSGTLSEEEVRALIATYAPVVRLHPDDPYRPDDPEQILNAATLQWALVRNEGAYCAAGTPPDLCQWFGGQYFEHLDGMPTSAATLMADVAHIESEVKPNPPYNGHPDFRVWLSIPDPLIHGDSARARPVVHVRPRGPFTEIQFWFFYPFNGPGRVEICVAVFGCEVNWFSEAGRHYGDWEMVSLLVDNRDRAMIAAGLSQHGVVEWVRYDRLHRHTDDVRPLVYSAFHSHAIYRNQGRQDYEVARETSAFTATLFDITDTTGLGPLLVVDDYYLAGDEPGILPSWLGFPYRWGQYIVNHEDVEWASTNYYDEDEVNPGPTGPPKKSEW
jgi:hypothetical protein